MLAQALLVFCVVGPTPPPGYDEPWADVRMILRIPAQPQLLRGFGEVRDLRPAEALMWNPAGNEIPLTGAVTSGTAADGTPTWKATFTGNLWQPRHGGMPESEPVPYHVISLNLEVPMSASATLGLRDDPWSIWGIAHGWHQRWPGMSGSGDDMIRGAPVWSVPCL